MSTFNELCLSQIQKTSEIRQILKDYHKAGKAKRTSTFVGNKLSKLEDLWRSFEETDKQITEHTDFNEGHDYFKESCYDKTEDWYKLTKTTLSDRLKSISEQGNLCENPFQIPPPKFTSNPKSNTDTTETDCEEKSSTNEMRYKIQEDKIKSISRIINSLNIDILTTASRIYLEQKLNSLNKHWEIFEFTHQEIVKNATPVDLEKDYFVSDVFGKTETSYEETIVAIQEQLDCRFPSIAQNTTIAQNTQFNSPQAHNLTIQNHSTFSISEARSIIPNFNGNSKELHKFISCCDDIYTKLSTSTEAETFFSLVKSKLFADAYNAFKYSNTNNWPDLKRILTQTFEEKIEKSVLQSKLTNTRQKPGESVKDFLERVNVIFVQLNEATYNYTTEKMLITVLLKDNERTAIRAIEDGLLSEQLQTLAKLYPDKTFSSLKAHILDHASRLEPKMSTGQSKYRPNLTQQKITNWNIPNKRDRQPHNPATQPTCYKCNRQGHLHHNVPRIKILSPTKQIPYISPEPFKQQQTEYQTHSVVRHNCPIAGTATGQGTTSASAGQEKQIMEILFPK